MKRFWVVFTLCFVSLTWLRAQVATSFKLAESQQSPLLPSNTIDKIVPQGDTIWIGTGKGLAFSLSDGRAWNQLGSSETFDAKGVSAIALRGGEIWASTSYTTTFDNQDYATGHGLHYSLDHGATWKFIAQPVDTGKVDTIIYGKNKIPALAITVPQQNVVYDIALTKSTVWIASWAGMLRKSTDHGATWQRVILPPDNLNHISPTDTLHFALSNVTKFFASDSLYNKDTLRASLNHELFSVYASSDSTIWAGTANGINKSTDGGISWRKFNHQNQLHGISGDWVVAITQQRWRSAQIIWAATVNAVDPDEKRGVSFSSDGGESWGTALLGEFVHNITVRDSIVYVAADGGLYRSSDFGTTWTKSGTIYDPNSLQRITTPITYASGTTGDTVWVGGPDGLSYTLDSPSQPFGSSWKVFRTYESVQASGKTYSYPLPFSPAAELVRIHYSTPATAGSVTIRIFDFGMQPVKTLIRSASRSANNEYDEVWDGRDDANRRVSNGVYFYRVEVGGIDPMWGKILVLQ